MQAVGITTQQEVFIVSKERKFRINEILILEDEALHFPRGEVIETLSYNRFIPMGLDKSLVDHQVIQTLENIGYNVNADEINLAKLRLYEEASHPIRTGCAVRLPRFEEVRDLLVKSTPEEAMLLGEIRGTESLSSSITSDLLDQVVLMEQGSLRSQQGVPFLFDIRTMQQYPHVGVFGGSGSGKSFGLRVMLEELMKLRIPTIVFDPHFEMDFSQTAAGMEERNPGYTNRFVKVQVGQEVGIQFTDLSTRDLTGLLTAAGGGLSESMVNVVQMVHKKRDSYTSFSDRINNLVQALEEGKQGLEKQLRNDHLTPTEVQRIRDLQKLLNQYSTLPLSSVKGIDWRLKRLEAVGLFQQDIRSIITGLEQGKLVVVQGSTWVLQVFATYVIGALYSRRRAFKDARMNGEEGEFFPPFVIVTDEAHNFAPKAIESPTKSILKEIAQEGRKYGAFLFLATQRPTLLDETITAQLNTKFVFRTVRGTDIATLREETDLTPEEGKRLPYLRSGDTFISSAVFGRTIFIRIRCAHTTSPHLANPFDELQVVANEKNEKIIQALRSQLPLFDTDLLQAVAQINQSFGLNWDIARLKSELNRLDQEGFIKKHQTPFAVRYDIP
ncbi:ATP-binding protein [Hazenella sp. IB182357]|uniref:ATP-binding protein n=1 Tax=Polycladospora coralii TaxID=2771432 RepID=A0A926RUK6_9BACL|nr:ATP-binding protein [Polycladospora coralii]MBD1372479.1 ATP-binding protein [Polycladospora coralii]MBS7531801.1 ATP-binding protein [Polycladospora coralii]